MALNRFLQKISLILLLFCGLTSKAQDIHFSQFFFSPLSIAPSNTGNVDGDWRIMANYRSQWREIKPYLTQSIGGDKQFYLYNERLSGGIFIINDKSGGNLKVNKFLVSAAYHKKLGKSQFHIGLQPGYVMKSIDYMSETYPNQLNWNTGHFDNALPNNETGITNQNSFFDLNIGGGWDLALKYITPYVSYSIFHLNRPNDSFFGADNHLKQRKVIATGALWYCTPKLSLSPNILYMNTTKASEFVAGTHLYYSLGAERSVNKAVFVGGYFRKGFKNLTDAAFAVVGMNYKYYTAGISYDFNISELKTATSGKGALEISFIYTGLNTRLHKTQIPCDRY